MKQSNILLTSADVTLTRLNVDYYGNPRVSLQAAGWDLIPVSGYRRNRNRHTYTAQAWENDAQAIDKFVSAYNAATEEN